MTSDPRPIRGRGAAGNPPNRFECIQLERDVDWNPEDDPLPRTQFFKDRSQTIIATNESPDVGFEASLNPYHGCEMGSSTTTASASGCAVRASLRSRLRRCSM